MGFEILGVEQRHDVGLGADAVPVCLAIHEADADAVGVEQRGHPRRPLHNQLQVRIPLASPRWGGFAVAMSRKTGNFTWDSLDGRYLETWKRNKTQANRATKIQGSPGWSGGCINTLCIAKLSVGVR